MNRDFLSKAIDELPYSIKPTAYAAYKDELIQKASITENGCSLFENVFKMFDRYAKEHMIKIDDKTMTDYTLTLIYVATCNERQIEFEFEETPLIGVLIDLVDVKGHSIKMAGLRVRIIF